MRNVLPKFRFALMMCSVIACTSGVLGAQQLSAKLDKTVFVRNLPLTEPQEYSKIRPLSDVLDALGKKFNVTFAYESSVVENMAMDISRLDLSEKSLIENLGELPPALAYHKVSNSVYALYKRNIDQTKGKGSGFMKVPNTTPLKSDSPITDLLMNVIPEIAQGVQITGTVTSGDDGTALPGVNVIVKGTTVGTTTDINGKYVLQLDQGQNVLIFSFIGYESQEVEVADRTVIDVALKPQVQTLDEVVVVGYGTQKKSNLTGSVDVISNKQIQSRQAPTVSQLLQGQAPGLSFSVDNFGFQPGAQMNIDIRGMGSLNGGAPYVLIDGIPGDMDRLNPEDIESISILKDASASAIYGARAPYGVILITTKSGLNNEKISVTYSGNVSRSSPQRLPEMLDSYTYTRALNEAGINAGGMPFTTDVIDRIIAFQAGDYDFIKQYTVPDATFFETVPESSGQWGRDAGGNANYDWFDEWYGHSWNQKHNLSLQGGGKTTSYYFSAGSIGQDGVLNYGTDTYDRLNVLGKFKTAITDWWDFTYQTRFMKSIRELPNPQNRHDYDVIFHQIARTPPNMPKYDGFGNIMIQSKIPWVNDGGTDRIEITENWHTFSTVLRPLQGLEVNADFAYQSVDLNRVNKSLVVYDVLPDKTVIPSAQTVPSTIEQIYQNNHYWTSNVYSSYKDDINDIHHFAIMAGVQLESRNIRELDVMKNNLLVQDVASLQTASGDPSAEERLTHWSTQGYFSRLNYDYKEKYLFETSIRRDGTSRFREGNRWGFFPSFSSGWVISRENFWRPLENLVSTFKIRGSWGRLGNQNVPLYQDLNLIPLRTTPLDWIFEYGDTRPIGYTETPYLVSSDLSWETATTTNLGVDMSFLRNRLQMNFDWFERVTSEMIAPSEAQPGVLGASLPQDNNATLQTRGWELSLSWANSINADMSYFVNANMYDSKSVVTEYLNPTGTLGTWYNGKEAGEIWGYTAYDLYRSQEELDAHQSTVNTDAIWGGKWRPGDVRYEDINGDGLVDNGSNTIYDKGDLSIIGNSAPHYQFGLSAGFNYKGFDFSMLWKGTLKRDMFFGRRENIFWGFRNWVQTSLFPEHLDYYRDREGDKYSGLYEGKANFNLDAYWPRPYNNNPENDKNRLPSTRYLQNAAYVRLQNVQLGYNLPNDLLSKWHLQNVRVYLAGENLLTITELPKGVDPIAISSRYGSGKTYGADRVLYVGLTVTY